MNANGANRKAGAQMCESNLYDDGEGCDDDREFETGSNWQEPAPGPRDYDEYFEQLIGDEPLAPADVYVVIIGTDGSYEILEPLNPNNPALRGWSWHKWMLAQPHGKFER